MLKQSRVFGVEIMRKEVTWTKMVINACEGETMKPKFFEVVKYRFDNIMAKGLVALIGLLALISLIFVSIIALVVVAFGLFPPNEELDFLEVVWLSVLRTLDPGTMGQDAGLGFRTAMFIVTLSGVVIVASLIGVISNAFNARVDQLRKGHSKVLEKDHILILGWSGKVHQILHEVTLANQSRRNSTVVILADQDKVEMEDELRSHGHFKSRTRIIVRSGDPMRESNLHMVRANDARSLIILAPDSLEDADSFSLKTALAILNGKDRKNAPYQIVAEIKEEQNLEVAELIGKGQVVWINAEEVISRLIVQTSRQSGLSTVYSDLLDFEGNELYLKQADSLAGLSYLDASLSQKSSCLIGFVRDGQVFLNPALEAEIRESDQLILLSLDDSSIEFGQVSTFDEAHITAAAHYTLKPDKTLILGTNHALNLILAEINDFSPIGSSVKIVDTSIPEFEREHGNLQIETLNAEPSSRKVLQSVTLDEFNHIIVLADRESRTSEQADARTLLTLLNLRELMKESPRSPNIVSEMLNDHNRELAESASPDDFIVSEKLISNLISEITEDSAISPVIRAVLSSDGAQVKLQPAEYFVTLGEEVDFNTVTVAALRRGESAMGYRLKAGDAQLNQGVALNPSKTEKIVFAPGDAIVVLSNE